MRPCVSSEVLVSTTVESKSAHPSIVLFALISALAKPVKRELPTDFKHIKKDKKNDIYYDKTQHVKFRGAKQDLNNS